MPMTLKIIQSLRFEMRVIEKSDCYVNLFFKYRVGQKKYDCLIYYNLKSKIAIIKSNTMIFWKLVIKCPRKPREVCGIPEGEARGNSTNLPRVRDI